MGTVGRLDCYLHEVCKLLLMRVDNLPSNYSLKMTNWCRCLLTNVLALCLRLFDHVGFLAVIACYHYEKARKFFFFGGFHSSQLNNFPISLQASERQGNGMWIY